MKLSDNVFLGSDIKKPEKILKKLHKGKLLRQYYFVIYNDINNRIEILNSKIFMQPYYNTKDYIFYAVFSSDSDAYEYIRCITDISYTKYDSFKPFDVINTVRNDEIEAVWGKEACI